MKRERLTDREVLEEIVGRPHFNIKHPDYLERIQLGLPEEEDESLWFEQYPEEEEYDGPIHEIQKEWWPSEPEDYWNIGMLKKR